MPSSWLVLMLAATGEGLGVSMSPLEQLSELAGMATGATESYVDPRIGTWRDNPVGGAAERDGSWLCLDARRTMSEVLESVGAPHRSIAERMVSGEGGVYSYADCGRYEVRICAVGRGRRVEDTQPSGTVTLSVVLCGRVRTAPMRRDPTHCGDLREAGWLERSSSSRIRSRSSGVSTMLGGPPRALEGISNAPSLVLDVILRPPKDERITVPGPRADRRLGLSEELANFFRFSTEKIEIDDDEEISRRLVSGRGLGELRVGGLDDEISALARRLLWSRCLDPEELSALGVKHVKGALLSGPPGCGKTTVAREIARVLGVDDYRLAVVNGPELLDKFVGNSEKAVRDLFVVTKSDAALRMVVLDEIDSLCRERGSLSGDTTGIRDSITAQLLACLDGVEDSGNVIVIGTTNRPDLLDPALLRPGRLEVSLEIKPPSSPQARRAILEIHARPLMDKLSDEAFNFLFGDEVAERTRGRTGADLAGIVRSAVSSAVQRAAIAGNATVDTISKHDIHQALTDVLVALPTRREQKATAKPVAAWPLMSRLEEKWHQEHGSELPQSTEAVRAFLEHLAYSKRTIRLPVELSKLDDLTHHLFRYLLREG